MSTGSFLLSHSQHLYNPQSLLTTGFHSYSPGSMRSWTPICCWY